MENNSGEDDRVTVTRDQFFDLMRGDLKLLRKLLCLCRYFLSCNIQDQIFNALLAQSEIELTEKVQRFFLFFAAAAIDPAQNIDDIPVNVFLPPVPERECLFARNGIFIDTKACFQTRDVPLNTVTPFKSVRNTYFLLEHAHEALEMSCQLRLRQLAYLKANKPDIIIEEIDAVAHVIEMTTDTQLIAAQKIIFEIGAYAYEKSKAYGDMLEQ